MKNLFFFFLFATICTCAFCFINYQQLHFINTISSSSSTGSYTTFLVRRQKEKKKDIYPVRLSSSESPIYLNKIKSNIFVVGNKLFQSSALLKVATVIFTLGSLTSLYIYKNLKIKENQRNKSESDDGQLYKYRCEKCNLVMFPAKGREKKFLKQNDVCPNCKNSNMSKIATQK